MNKKQVNCFYQCFAHPHGFIVLLRHGERNKIQMSSK